MTTPSEQSVNIARELGVIGHYHCEDSWYSCPLAPDGCADDGQPADKCTCDYEGRINKIATALDAQRERDAKVVREKCEACEGTGYASPQDPDSTDECMYCGVPIQAIRQQVRP